MLRALVVYATTSGSTRILVERILRAIPSDSAALNIAELEAEEPLPAAALIIAATPTYGKGDAHSAWVANGPGILRSILPGQRVALIGLGDSRGHPKTFAGGLGVLKDLFMPQQPRFVGAVPSASYSYEASPAEQGGLFPGLVIEYRRNRRYAEARAEEWVREMIEEKRAI